MPRGGARAGAGRPPAEQSRAKDREARRIAAGKQPIVDDGVWLTLPREGRGGSAPAWPLSKPSKPTTRSRRELEVWRRLWKLPEALGWERAGNVLQVALYVRTLVRAEEDDAPVGLVSQVRIQQAELGLTPAGKKTLNWKVGAPPRSAGVQPATHVEGTPATMPSPPPVPEPGRSPKERMKLVPGAG